MQYALTPVFYFLTVPGLNIYATFEKYDYENSTDFNQYIFGLNYDRSWNDRFISSFTFDIGHRDLNSTEIAQLNMLHTYYFTDLQSVVLGLDSSITDSTIGKDESISGHLTLNLYF